MRAVEVAPEVEVEIAVEGAAVETIIIVTPIEIDDTVTIDQGAAVGADVTMIDVSVGMMIATAAVTPEEEEEEKESAEGEMKGMPQQSRWMSDSTLA